MNFFVSRFLHLKVGRLITLASEASDKEEMVCILHLEG